MINFSEIPAKMKRVVSQALHGPQLHHHEVPRGAECGLKLRPVLLVADDLEVVAEGEVLKAGQRATLLGRYLDLRALQRP